MFYYQVADNFRGWVSTLRSKEPLPRDLAVCILIAVLAAVSLLIAPASFTWIIKPPVFFALFFLLCYALLAVLFPRRGDLQATARLAVSAAFGLGGGIVVGLLLPGDLQFTAPALVLALISISLAVYAHRRRASLPKRKRFTVASRQGFTPLRSRGVVRQRSILQRHIPSLAVLVLAIALTSILAYFIMSPQETGITRLNILGDYYGAELPSGSVSAGQISPLASAPASPPSDINYSNESDNRSDVEVLTGGQSLSPANNTTNSTDKAVLSDRRQAVFGGGGSTTTSTPVRRAQPVEPKPSRMAEIEDLKLDEEEPEEINTVQGPEEGTVIDNDVEDDLERDNQTNVSLANHTLANEIQANDSRTNVSVSNHTLTSEIQTNDVEINDTQAIRGSLLNNSLSRSKNTSGIGPVSSATDLDEVQEVNVSPFGNVPEGEPVPEESSTLDDMAAQSPDDQRPAGGKVNQPPIITDLRPSLASPQRSGPKITWTARASDPEDPILYRFYLNGLAVTGWSSSQNWTWPTSGWKPGEYRVKVWVRDGKHAPVDDNDGWMETLFVISTDNLPPVIEDLTSDLPAPQTIGTRIVWTASAEDPEDQVFYRFMVDGRPATAWTLSPSWVWSTEGLDPGEHSISVWAWDGNHAGEDGFDSALNTTFLIISPLEEVTEESPVAADDQPETAKDEAPLEEDQPSEPANQPPKVFDLLADPPSPQVRSTLVTWSAFAEDPEDPLLYRFLLNGQAVTGWTASKNWSWDTSESLPGEYRITVWVRDGRHAGEEGFDSSLDAVFTISSLIDQEIDRPMQNRSLSNPQIGDEGVDSSTIQVVDGNQAPRQAVLGKGRPASGDQGSPAMVRVGR